MGDRPRLVPQPPLRERVHVAGGDVENVVKLSQRQRKIAVSILGKGVLGKKIYISWVEPLGFIEIRVASVPLAPSASNIGQRFRNPAAIGQERTCSFKITHCRVVILQGCVVDSILRLARPRPGPAEESSAVSAACRASSRRAVCWLEIEREIAERINVREQRPTKSELWVQPHRFPKMLLRAKGIGDRRCRFQCISEAAQIGIIRLRIVCRFGRDVLLFLPCRCARN